MVNTTAAQASPESASAFVSSLDFAPALGTVGQMFVSAAKAKSPSAAQRTTPPSQTATQAAGAAPAAGSAQAQSGTTSSQQAGASPSPATAAGAAAAISGIQQQFVVGNAVVSFDGTVTSDLRQATLNSMLLAQLQANKSYPDPKQPGYSIDWLSAYMNSLYKIGWINQGNTQGTTSTSTEGTTVDSIVLTIAADLVGGTGAAALKAVIGSLQSLFSSNTSPITIFQQSIQKSDVLEFSSSIATDSGGNFEVKIAQFGVQAKDMQTQVLFFKWGVSHANIAWNAITLSLNEQIYNAVATSVTAQIVGFSDAVVPLTP
jgi:hypothetical protein